MPLVFYRFFYLFLNFRKLGLQVPVPPIEFIHIHAVGQVVLQERLEFLFDLPGHGQGSSLPFVRLLRLVFGDGLAPPRGTHVVRHG